jgi:DNA modification methylase
VKPYYEEKGIQIWHGDCREVFPSIMRPIDCIVTDPPYGIAGMKSSLRVSRTSKGDYDTELFEDTPENVLNEIIPAIGEMREHIGRCVMTPGQVNIHKYPAPDHMGVFYYPASCSVSRWGIRLWQPIFYYGKDPYQGKLKNDSLVCVDSDRTGDHPCPKPIKSWKCLTARATIPGDMILDPYMGTGTTLVAAKDLGRDAIGIEIEEKYCEIAANRLRQEVLNFER